MPVSVVLIAAWTVVSLATYWGRSGFSAAVATVYICLAVMLTRLSRDLRSYNIRPIIGISLAVCAVGFLLRGGYWSQLSAGEEFAAVLTTTLCMLTVAVLVCLGRGRYDRAAVVFCLVTVIAVNAYAIVETTPRIDVWNFTNQAAAAFPHENFYGRHWSGVSSHPAPYVVTEGFPYLPMGVLLLAPFEWLIGDIRWGLLICLVVAGVTVMIRHRGTQAALLALLLWLTPGNLLMIESAWNETVLLVLLLPGLLCFARGKPRLGMMLLVLALATKQHTWVILPVLAAWAPVGARRVAKAAGGAAALCLPWLLTNPAAFYHDTVTLHMDMAPREDATTLYIWALRLGWEPPFWFSAIILVGSVAAIAYAVHQRRPGLSGISAALAGTLLIANLVNKQAFLNQYWLVASLLLFAAPLDRTITELSGAHAEGSIPATGGHTFDEDAVGAPPAL